MSDGDTILDKYSDKSEPNTDYRQSDHDSVMTRRESYLRDNRFNKDGKQHGIALKCYACQNANNLLLTFIYLI